MVRIAGINIPDNKNIMVSLTYIYGIGKSISKKICDNLNINYYKIVKDLNSSEVNLIRKNISNYLVEGDLRREIMLNIKRLVDINCYKGIRHKKGLPVRGQKTKNNSKTCKKNRKYIK